MKRPEIYSVLDEEREYQEKRWNKDPNRKTHEIESWMTYMEHYLNEAKKDATLNDDAAVALINLRKVVALGIACFEIHGVPRR